MHVFLNITFKYHGARVGFFFPLSETWICSHAQLHSATPGGSPVKLQSSGIELQTAPPAQLQHCNLGDDFQPVMAERYCFSPTFFLKVRVKHDTLREKSSKWAQISAKCYLGGERNSKSVATSEANPQPLAGLTSLYTWNMLLEASGCRIQILKAAGFF